MSETPGQKRRDQEREDRLHAGEKARQARKTDAEKKDHKPAEHKAVPKAKETRGSRKS